MTAAPHRPRSRRTVAVVGVVPALTIGLRAARSSGDEVVRAAAPITSMPTPRPARASTPAPSTAPALRAGLAPAAVAAAEKAVGDSTQLAVAVLDRVAGEKVVGGRGGESFFAASLSKVVVAVDVLDRRRLEGLAVTDADLDLFRRALGRGDDSAVNALWSRFDARERPGG